MNRYNIPTKIDCENIDAFLNLWEEYVNDIDSKLIDPEDWAHFTPLSVCLHQALHYEMQKVYRTNPDFYENQIDDLKQRFPKWQEQISALDPQVMKEQEEQRDKITRKIDVYPWSDLGLNLTFRYFPSSMNSQERMRLRQSLNDFIKSRIKLHKNVDYLSYHILKETMENSFEHGNSGLGCYISVQIINSNIEFCILDRGVGIYNSLKKKYSFIDDSKQAIREALKRGVTKERDPDRGLGLWTVNHRIMKNQGKMCIISGNGIYRYEYDHENSREIEVSSTLDHFFTGTIVNVTINNNPDFTFYDDEFEEGVF